MKRRVIAGQVNENTDRMRQDFTNQTALKMPKIVCADMVCFEAFRQMRANGFNALPDASAELEERFRQRSFHILSRRRDSKNSVTLQQERLPALINEAFVRRSCAFKFLQQDVCALNIVRTCRQQGGNV